MRNMFYSMVRHVCYICIVKQLSHENAYRCVLRLLKPAAVYGLNVQRHRSMQYE